MINREKLEKYIPAAVMIVVCLLLFLFVAQARAMPTEDDKVTVSRQQWMISLESAYNLGTDEALRWVLTTCNSTVSQPLQITNKQTGEVTVIYCRRGY